MFCLYTFVVNIREENASVYERKRERKSERENLLFVLLHPVVVKGIRETCGFVCLVYMKYNFGWRKLKFIKLPGVQRNSRRVIDI